MFGIGYQEMFIVLVVALVIFGPSRLPAVKSAGGFATSDVWAPDLTGEFEKTFAEVDEVKKTFKREMQGIQEEVEGVGKSARGDLKKSGSKAIGGGQKTGSAAAKKGSATASHSARSSSLSKTTRTAREAGENGSRSKAARGNKLDGTATEAVPVATKSIHWPMSPSSTSTPSW